jgi:hypothetical protein
VIAWLPNNKTSSTQEWNLQISQQIGNATTFNIAYVGNKSNHLMTYFNYNNAGNTIGGKATFPNLYNVNVAAATGSGNYNALQTQVNHRMTNGLQYTLAYTWSHALDNSDGAFSTTGSNGAIIVDPAKGGLLQYNYGNANDDQRQAFTFAAMYELPFGHGKRWGSNWNTVTNQALGGWQANLIASIGTGTPFNITPNGLLGNYTGGATVGYQGKAPNGNVVWVSLPQGVAPTSVFTTATPTNPGNFHRNSFYGPGYNPIDLSIFKDFGVTERLKMQFRAEAYNLFNTPQFTGVNTNVNDPVNFGTINSTRAYSEREVQFALRFTF